jgi:hypothetical protein
MPILRLFLDICLLKKGPQDMPLSSLLWGLTFGGYVLVGITVLGLQSPLFDAVEQTFLEAGILLGFCWVTLQVAGLASRFTQTSLALLGSDAVISSFAIPLLLWLTGSEEKQPGAYLLLLLLMLWHLVVVAHILRHALSKPAAVGLGLAIVYLVASYQIMFLLFAPTG